MYRSFLIFITAILLITATPAFAKPAWTSSQREIDCIAAAVHHEARGEPLAGQVAVAEVVIARARSGKYPSKPCQVVTQRKQFSFVRNGRIPHVEPVALRRSRVIVRNVIAGTKRTRVRGSLFFHAIRLPRQWNRPLAGQIGGHVFYR